MENKNKHKSGNHEKLIAWQMADELDVLVQEFIKKLPKYEYKIISQIDSASDSIGANIVEGYYSNSTREFSRFLKYARRSCAEVQERIRRLKRKELIEDDLCEKCCDHCIRTGYIIDRLILSLEDKNT